MPEHAEFGALHGKAFLGQLDTIRLDTKRIKEEQPELYRKFSRAASSRRFRVLIAEISGIEGLD